MDRGEIQKRIYQEKSSSKFQASTTYDLAKAKVAIGPRLKHSGDLKRGLFGFRGQPTSGNDSSRVMGTFQPTRGSGGRVYLKEKQSLFKFAFKNHALRAVSNLDGWVFQGYSLKISKAKFRRGDQGIKTRPLKDKYHQVEMSRRIRANAPEERNDRNVDHKGNRGSYSDVVLGRRVSEVNGEAKESLENQGHEVRMEKPTLAGNISGEKDANMIEKLKCCLIGELVIPLIADEVIPSLLREWVELKGEKHILCVKEMKMKLWKRQETWDGGVGSGKNDSDVDSSPVRKMNDQGSGAE
ncbi:hypothetical protein PIB30_028559 [Stylosanthes scabra]|uniref:Uncharacterized protein n=1 Tax=Stylosanthes scabra TaxID=79078 RepID=A0ABU6TD63_9FABA|nr:hypothetical protein [Stylosanthes scabra]